MAVTFATPTDSTNRLPAGRYIMKLKDIAAEESTYKPGEERLKFTFDVKSVEKIAKYPDDAYPVDIDEDDDEAHEEAESLFNAALVGKEHWAWCSNKMGGNATLRKWLTGMLGRTIGKDEVPDPNEVIGKSYEVTLGMVSYTFDGKPGEKFDIALIAPHKVPRRTRGEAEPAPARQRTPKSNEENLAPWERDDDE
jgi:hypothetical protein